MLLTPRAMAVFGLLYMNGGESDGKQLVPVAWIDASLTGTWANNSSKWGALTDYNYGYLWWLGKINGYDMFFAMGLGGQYILNFPELNRGREYSIGEINELLEETMRLRKFVAELNKRVAPPQTNF